MRGPRGFRSGCRGDAPLPMPPDRTWIRQKIDELAGLAADDWPRQIMKEHDVLLTIPQ